MIVSAKTIRCFCRPNHRPVIDAAIASCFIPKVFAAAPVNLKCYRIKRFRTAPRFTAACSAGTPSPRLDASVI